MEYSGKLAEPRCSSHQSLSPHPRARAMRQGQAREIIAAVHYFLTVGLGCVVLFMPLRHKMGQCFKCREHARIWIVEISFYLRNICSD